MKIAILGWGSLLWQPKDLQFDKEIGWSKNGPMLPIEFARISKDGRLTLVITKDWTYSKATFLIGVSYHFLSTRIYELEQDIKKLEGNHHGQM